MDTLSPNPASYINFQLTHGTPGVAPSTPHWVQYCTCSSGGRTLLYRVDGYFGKGPPTSVRHVSRLGRPYESEYCCRRISGQGFWGNGHRTTPDQRATATRSRSGCRRQPNANPSIRLVSRVTPRNYCRYNSSTLLYGRV